jgi:hypothetical protein
MPMHVISHARRVTLLALVPLVLLGVMVHLSIPPVANTNSDIYYPYLEGQHILAGQNPYIRILAGNMRVNEKYPTYFPLFYWLSALAQRAGLTEFPQWLDGLRWLLLAFNVGAACILFEMLYRRRGLGLAVFGVLFWFLNRWNLQITQVANFDYIPIFCLLLSLWLLPRRRWSALLLLSVSLALKQIALLIVPLYLIWVWQSVARRRIRAMIESSLVIASVPILTTLPFLFWPGHSVWDNSLAFVRSVLFSITRDPALHVNAPSLDSLMGWSGAAGHIPMFLLVALVAVVFWRRKLTLHMAVLLTMVVFVNFNAVLFLQYFCWLAAFVPLAAADMDVGATFRPLPT